jgi:hypothetical protein
LSWLAIAPSGAAVKKRRVPAASSAGGLQEGRIGETLRYAPEFIDSSIEQSGCGRMMYLRFVTQDETGLPDECRQERPFLGLIAAFRIGHHLERLPKRSLCLGQTLWLAVHVPD